MKTRFNFIPTLAVIITVFFAMSALMGMTSVKKMTTKQKTSVTKTKISLAQANKTALAKYPGKAGRQN